MKQAERDLIKEKNECFDTAGKRVYDRQSCGDVLDGL